MFKRKAIMLLVFVFTLGFVLPLGIQAADDVTILHEFKFDSETMPGGTFTAAASASEIEWVSGDGVGKDDNNALRVTKDTAVTYTSAANAVRLTLAEPLLPGAKYNVSAWFYVPAQGNEGKSTLRGPGFVVNEAYDEALGVSKFPANNDATVIATGSWVEVNETFEYINPVTVIDFRFYTNEAPTHPDVWYIDNVTISQVGEWSEPKVPRWDLTLPSLKEAFADYFLIGNATSPRHIRNAETAEMFKHHYSVITAENDMKPGSIARNRNNFNFSNADALVDWAEENGIKMVGHALLWHEQSADWLTIAEDGGPVTRAEAKANMEEYINAVAGRYAGRIYAWDVVNEAFLSSVGGVPADWKSALRTQDSQTQNKPSWFQAYANGADASKGESGADFIYDAFVFARLADPDALLLYNDFNETEEGKREAMALMAEDLNEKWKSDERNTEPDRLLVEGLGMQAHYWTNNLHPHGVDLTIQRFIQAGVVVSITELDIPIGAWRNMGEATEENLARQAELYKEVFEVFMKHAEHIDRVTFWGKADEQSWRAEGSPLLFDKYFDAKPAFFSILGLVDDSFSEQPGENGEDNGTPPPGENGENNNPPEIPADTEPEDHTLLIIIGVVGGAVVMGGIGAVMAFVMKKKKS
jgi:GH35 family endo-1,4-beta-xylanase